MAVAPRRPVLIVAPLAAIVAIVSLLGYAALHGVSGGRTSALLGKPAPEFSYATFDGQPIDLASLRGKPVMVNFWGSWCVPCKDEAPVLAQAWQTYQGTGVQFLGVSIWDKPDAARSFAQNAGAVWLTGLDNDGKIAIDYGVSGVPESFFISRDGVLIDRFPGPFVGSDGSSSLDRYLQRLLST
ncbi:MAG TPA: redoxin domain-containing protein [Chloroflexota bacterium]|nr:redoxin domain-containing protein [Chloroflexota bacterium]